MVWSIKLWLLCRKAAFLCLVVLFVLCMGCREHSVQSLQQKPDKPSISQTLQPNVNRILGLTVYSFIENKDHIYHVRYPYGYFCPDYDKKYGSFSSLKHITPDYEKATEMHDYFVDYVTSLPQSNESEGEILAFVDLHYIDENGEQTCGASFYGEVPEGWDEFIQNFNLICGYELLSAKGDAVYLTADFLRDYFSIDDDDIVADKTVDDFLHDGLLVDAYSQGVLKLQIVDLFYIQNAIEEYENQALSLNEHLATDVVTAQSTEQEFNTFVEAFCNLTKCEELPGSIDQGYRYFLSPDGNYYALLQTKNIDSKKAVNQIGSITLEMHEGKLVLVEEWEQGAYAYHPLYYDRSGCYILAVFNQAEPEVLYAFVHGTELLE